MAKRRGSKKTRRVYVKAKKGYRKAKGILGGLGKGLSLKGIATGTAGLVLTQRFNPFGGSYKPVIDKIGAGLALGMLKMDNADLISSGIKEGLAQVVNSYLGGSSGSTVGGDSL